MRILIAGRGFDSFGRHEVGIFELDQARALKQAGHDVRFAAIDTRSVRRFRSLGCREYNLDGISVIYSSVPSGAKPAFLSAGAQSHAADLVWKRLNREHWSPEIVHSHFGTAMLEKAREHGAAAVYTEHFSKANKDSVPGEELERERKACALADRVICVSSSLADRIGRRHGIKTSVVPNIVDMSFTSCGPAHGSPDGVFRFVSTGSLIRRKGFDLLFRALAEVRRSNPEDVRLTVIGEGRERIELVSLARTLDIAEAVEFTGLLSRPEIVGLYRGADAFVLASRQETFGVVYIEAMAMGLPVIATSCGGPEDFVDDSNGFLIPKDDVPSLIEAMEKMIRERDRFNGANIADSAVSRFSPNAVAAALTAVYEEVTAC